MRVLVACEFSGIVRDAFLARGHDAYSCDILPGESKHPKNFARHFQEDILQLLARDSNWDLMIAHPPCTFLSNVGNRHIDAERVKKRNEAAKFFRALYFSPVKRIAVENPVGYMNTHFMRPTQIVDQFFFGDSERKKTCWWLKNLPPLEATDKISPPKPTRISGNGHKEYFHDAIDKYYRGFSKKELQHMRSKTFPGMANAIAEQWGSL